MAPRPMRPRLSTLLESGVVAYAAALVVSAILGRFAIQAILNGLTSTPYPPTRPTP